MPAGEFIMGPHTHRIDRRAFHDPIRLKVAQQLQRPGLVLLQGGKAFHIHDTDTENVFRQEGYFQYFFGVCEEDFLGAIDTRSNPPKSILFMPRLPAAYAVWMGHIAGPEEKRAQYAVDEVFYADELEQVLNKKRPEVVYLLEGVNSDSGQKSAPASLGGLTGLQTDTSSLYPIMAGSRAVKSPAELEVMRFANKIASAAHVEVMRQLRPGMMEYEAEAIFLCHCYRQGGCRHAPYTPICASGSNGAVLHYGHAGAPNDRQIQEDDMMLLDMGCEYYGYDSDITCSWPASGKFLPDQAGIYNAVLAAQAAVLAAMKPGVSWPAMHRLAESKILGGLKDMGLLKGDVDEMVEQRIGALFMPHGLGHLLGLDTHDVGGYLPGLPERSDQPGLKSLRTARELEENMVITVEPGCYFNSSLLEPAFKNPAQAQYLNPDAISKFLDFGGVRIEDDVIVTAQGAESMNNVPRTVQEIEAVMAGGPWPA